LERVAFVGDGPNDVTAAEVAGLAVAWGDAHEELHAVSDLAIIGPSMDLLRPYLLPVLVP
ncbi:MAG: HAD hydrolase family protein, partial [Myxococcota bacterium]|nr:HAD hydrolase family protein [Myxococcota bacterium]